MLDYLKGIKDKSISSTACKHLDELRKEWRNIPLVYEHNDLTFTNVIIQKLHPLRFKIIDWESMDINGFPALDLVDLCRSLKIYNATTNNLIQQYCIQLGVDARFIPLLKVIRLIRNREKWISESRLNQTANWVGRETKIVNELRLLKNGL